MENKRQLRYSKKEVFMPMLYMLETSPYMHSSCVEIPYNKLQILIDELFVTTSYVLFERKSRFASF